MPIAVAPRNVVRPNGIDMYHGDDREDADLSDAQLQAKFTAMLGEGIFWIMHKVSEGTDIVDARYIRRRDLAKSAGFVFFGGYHFLLSTNIEAQAENFVKSAQDDGIMCYAVDYERSNYSPSLQQLKEFCRLVDTALSPLKTSLRKIYGGGYIRDTMNPNTAGHKNNAMAAAELYFASKDLWLAEYGPHENIPWPWNAAQGSQKSPAGAWAWQFSGSGRLPDIVGNLDLDYFNGTPADLAKRWR